MATPAGNRGPRDPADGAASRRAGGGDTGGGKRQLFGVTGFAAEVDHFIEHDMSLVFKFAEKITVLVGGSVWSKAR
jgi:hypothetical protein